MGRSSRFTRELFIDAAVALTAEGGPAAVTLAAIARRVGGPTGSIYHRFQSRAEILAAAWVLIHGGFSDLVRAALAEGSGLLAALSIPAWARQNPMRARFLLLNEPASLVGGVPPDGLRQEMEDQERALEDSFQAYVQQAAGRQQPIDAETIARARFLIFDGPIALISPTLAAGEAIPGFVDAIIREMHAGVSIARGKATARVP